MGTSTPFSAETMGPSIRLGSRLSPDAGSAARHKIGSWDTLDIPVNWKPYDGFTMLFMRNQEGDSVSTDATIDERTVPGAAAPGLRPREQLLAALAGVWMIVGLFLDGLAHTELEPDSFFTTWHLILYSGFAAASLAVVVPVLGRHTTGHRWHDAIPEGHDLTLAGVAIFGAGAVFDLGWHEVVGFEVSTEALVSPSHLVLMFGAMLALSGPLRSGWSDMSETSPLSRWTPMVISLALLTGVAVFFTSYLTPFGRESAASYPATTTHTHVLDEATAESFGQLRETWGVSGILLSTVILLVPLMLLIRRVVPPTGAITLLGGGLGLLVPALGEYTQWSAGIAVFAAFATADFIVRRTESRMILGAMTATMLWSAYFIGLDLTDGVRWSPSLWVGAIVISAMVGAVVGLLVTPERASVSGAAPESGRA